MSYTVLAINPGSTSTKIVLYKDEERVFERSLSHSSKELAPFERIIDQFEFRKDIILKTLEEEKIDVKQFSAVVGRGGMLPNMKGGGYLVEQPMIDTFNEGLASPHASNLGALLAHSIAEPLGIPAYIYDSVTADDLSPVAKITGMPEVTKQSICHVLNMKAVSRKVAEKLGKKYEDMNIIVVHLGGGISLSLHHGGQIVECIRDDEGPFSPERSGSVPLLDVINLCFSGKYSKEDMIRKVRGKGGMNGYLGTQDLREVEAMIEAGDKNAELVYAAMVDQVAKGAGGLATVVSGAIDCIILTGGMAYSKKLTQALSRKLDFLAPIELMPGECEMEALAFGAMRLLSGEEEAKHYVHP